MARQKLTATDLGAWLCFEGEAGQRLRTNTMGYRE